MNSSETGWCDYIPERNITIQTHIEATCLETQILLGHEIVPYIPGRSRLPLLGTIRVLLHETDPEAHHQHIVQLTRAGKFSPR